MAAKDSTRIPPAQPFPRVVNGDAVISKQEIVEALLWRAHHGKPNPPVPNSPPLSFAEILLDNLSRFETAFPPRPLLVMCDFTDEYCDCREKATVHLIETEEGLCLRHFAVRLKEKV